MTDWMDKSRSFSTHGLQSLHVDTIKTLLESFRVPHMLKEIGEQVWEGGNVSFFTRELGGGKYATGYKLPADYEAAIAKGDKVPVEPDPRDERQRYGGAGSVWKRSKYVSWMFETSLEITIFWSEKNGLGKEIDFEDIVGRTKIDEYDYRTYHRLEPFPELNGRDPIFQYKFGDRLWWSTKIGLKQDESLVRSLIEENLAKSCSWRIGHSLTVKEIKRKCGETLRKYLT